MPKEGILPCRRCGKGRPASGGGKLDDKGSVIACGVCDGREFYRQKDFNTKLGLWITVLIIVASLALYLFHRPLAAFLVLVAGALLDLALYFGLGDIQICYKCRAIYRGFPIPAAVEGFDLKIHDKYVFDKKK
jgi:hypothetical protein